MVNDMAGPRMLFCLPVDRDLSFSLIDDVALAAPDKQIEQQACRDQRDSTEILKCQVIGGLAVA